MVRVDTRREVLRLYREILRTSRRFHWPNEQGELWCVSLLALSLSIVLYGALSESLSNAVAEQVKSATEERAHGDRRRALRDCTSGACAWHVYSVLRTDDQLLPVLCIVRT